VSELIFERKFERRKEKRKGANNPSRQEAPSIFPED